MKIRHLLATMILFVASFVSAQEPTQQEGAESQATAEATTSQKVILFGMTAAGVVLIGLGLRNSKLFRKK